MKHIALVFFILLFFENCSSSQKKYEHEVKQVLSSPMRFRRPLGASAAPNAVPGGLDYTAEVLPDEKFDCVKSQDILRDVLKQEVIDCFSQIKENKKASYRLMRSEVSELQLMEEEETPECLKKTLPKIPLPREVYFLTMNEKNYPACWVSRLRVDANLLMDFRLPNEKFEVQFSFPMQQVPVTMGELERFFIAVVLTPLFKDVERPGRMKVKTVPDSICRKCFNEPLHSFPVPRGEPLPPLWPL